MDNINFNFSNNFLWDVKLLGECLEVNDTEFLVIFNNGRAAKVITQDNQLMVIKLNVERYNPLTLWSDTCYPGLNEREALDKLKLIKGD